MGCKCLLGDILVNALVATYFINFIYSLQMFSHLKLCGCGSTQARLSRGALGSNLNLVLSALSPLAFNHLRGKTSLSSGNLSLHYSTAMETIETKETSAEAVRILVTR